MRRWLAAVVALALAPACGGSSASRADGPDGSSPDAPTEAPAASSDAPGERAPDAPMEAAPAVSYHTSFDLTEAPISEMGKWTHLGLDWALIDTENGIAVGTQTGTGGYDDSYAHLSGFPPDQTASAVIHKIANVDPSCTHEVEIHLRWSDAAHDAHGYECNLAFDGSYAQIVRWNGKLGDFTYLASGSVAGGVHDGDTISAAAVGDTIVLSVNGVEVTRANDATWATGNPGMGLWRGGPCGVRGDYGFTSYTASSLP